MSVIVVYFKRNLALPHGSEFCLIFCPNFSVIYIIFIDCTSSFMGLLDLPTEKCVSECYCGYVPYRNSSTPYCGPGQLRLLKLYVCCVLLLILNWASVAT